MTLVPTSKESSNDSPSSVGVAKDLQEDFVPVKSKHTFSTPKSKDRNDSSLVQKTKNTERTQEKVNTTNAKRSINDRTAECIKEIKKVYQDLQSNDEHHCLKLRADVNEDTNSLLSIKKDIMTEIKTRKDDLFHEIELLMANAKRPTKRTRHMDVKFFAIQQWVKRDLLTLARIATADNYADAFTKSLGRNLHYRHMDFIMGKLRPDFASPLLQPLACQSITFGDLHILPLSLRSIREYS